MTDLNYIDRTMEVKIAGQDSTGLGVNYVSADVNGNMLVKDYSDGPVTPGAVASASALIGGQFNTSLPTLTNTQQTAIQVDASGRLIIRPLTSADVVSAVQSGTWTVQQGTPPWSVVGTLTNNNSSPLANNVGVLPATAQNVINASRYTSNAQVLLVTDLAGNTNIDLQYYLGSAVSATNPIATTISDGLNVLNQAMSAYGTAPVGTKVMGVNSYITNIPAVTQSGTWTVQPGNTQNTTPWLTQDSADGPVTPGTVATKSTLIGGQFNTSLPTLTTGQQAAIQLDSNGRVLVDISNASLPVTQSGTWTVQQGTPPWSVVGTLTNNNSSPVANNVGALIATAQNVVNASRYTSNAQVLLVTDLAGNTNVDLQYYLGSAVSATNPIVTTISDSTNTIASAISAYGTAPTGTRVMGVNSYITNAPTVNQGSANATPWSQNLIQVGGSAITLGQKTMANSIPVVLPSDQTVTISGTIGAAQSGPWFVNQTGTWTVQQGTPPWTIQGQGPSSGSNLGNPVKIGGVYNPSGVTVITGDVYDLQIDVNGRLFTTDAADGPVTPGTAAGKSMLFGGQFNTSLPTLTTGQQSAIQLDSSGRLIISPTTQGLLAEDHNYGTVGATTLRTASQIGNATGAASFGAGATGAQTLRVEANQGAAGSAAWLTTDAADGSVSGGAAGTKSMLGGGIYNSTPLVLTNGQQASLQLNSSGYLLVAPPLLVAPATINITIQDTASTTTTGANGQNFITGSPTAASAASFALNNQDAVIVQVTGTWTGTLQIEISLDGGTTWSPNPVNQDGTNYILNSYSGNFTGRCNTVGYTNFRVRAIAAITGTATVKVTEANGIATVYISSPIKIVDAGGDSVNITANGDMQVADILNISSQYRAQSITTTAAEALGAATILANRKLLHITPTNGTIYWGYSNAVTTTTGSPLFPNNTLWLSVGASTHVYVIAAATTDSRIGELS